MAPAERRDSSGKERNRRGHRIKETHLTENRRGRDTEVNKASVDHAQCKQKLYFACFHFVLNNITK